MSILALIPVLGKVVEGIVGLVSEYIPDKDKANELKEKVLALFGNIGMEEFKSQVSVLMSEIRGENWLQRNWRPIAMLNFLGLLNAYWMGYSPPNLTEAILAEIFGLLKLGMGGYIVGRSAEKIAPHLKTIFGKA